MPIYDYKCKSCNNEESHRHSMSDSLDIVCEKCNERMVRIYYSFYVSVQNTHSKQLSKENADREFDMRQDLRENHLIHDFNCFNGDVKTVYDGVKSSGSMTLDKMQKTIEQNEIKREKKAKAWTEKSKKRVKERTLEMRERKQKEEREKRKITLS